MTQNRMALVALTVALVLALAAPALAYRGVPGPPADAPQEFLGLGYNYVDNDGDGYCDYLQDPELWSQGPGQQLGEWVDENNDGICDFYDPENPQLWGPGPAAGPGAGNGYGSRR